MPALAGSHAERLLNVLPQRTASAPGRGCVLIVDQDVRAAVHVREQLAALSHPVAVASSAAAAREILATREVSLIVCDPAVPDQNPGQFLSHLLEYTSAQGIAVVVLASDPREVTERQCYALGADVYFAKPVSMPALLALLRTRLRKIEADRNRMLQDPVTGLPNVRVFRDAFLRTAFLAAREREPLSLALLHFDAIREVRTRQGTAAGDDVLRTLAAAVAASLRKSDLLARWDGDSLLVLLPHTNVAGTRRAVEKIYHRLQRLPVETGQEPPAGVPISVGIAEADHDQDFQATLDAAVHGLSPFFPVEERISAAAAAPAKEELSRVRVLVADDDELTASLIRHRLEKLGLDVLMVHDGSAVLSAAPTEDVSLVVMDVKMPFVDGFEALRRLRSIRGLRHVPVILLTSLGNEEDIAHGFELGADDYIVKPFSLVELQARVQRLLRVAA